MASRDRMVWIVGDPEDGSGHRYHVGDCYVLDQGPNRDHVRKILRASLPDDYAPCQICAPEGRRGAVDARAREQLPENGEVARGIRAGYEVELEDMDNLERQRIRLIAAGSPRSPGDVSVQSPIGSALLGKVEGEVVKVVLPRGAARTIRIVSAHVAPALQ